MARTGYLINVYMDANPYSDTYGQEMTERVLDTEECQTQQAANYVLVYTYCEMNAVGGYTGNCVSVYEDVEPSSPTYGEQMEQISTDQVLCPPDSPDADWQQEGESYCEQIAYQPSGRLGNSGYIVTVYRDVNEYSPTYNTTREVKEQDLTNCPLPSTTPVWVIISETCHLENGLRDGTKDVVRVDTNPYSPYYNGGLPETANIADAVLCPAESTAPEWTETSYSCVLDEGYRTGYVTVTEEDTNPHSSTYGQTRTRTYEDSTRCPYQPKPQPVTLKWKVINNRSGSTDVITSLTATCNDGLTMSMTGTIQPAGGQVSMTMPLSGTKVDTPFVVSSVTLSPNTSLPTLYQWTQSPNPFVWSDTNGSAVLTITLTDGDGTAPIWTEQSYVCNTVSGFRDGSSTVTEEDTNPNSGTYGQTRTRTIQNDSRCPAQTSANWVESSYSCQQESGHNTGNAISVQTDTNPMSSTYNTTRTVIIANDSRCPTTSTPDWVEISYTCQQQSGHNTGVIEITEKDVNPGSPTYNVTRNRAATGDPRCVRDETPEWVEESYACEQAVTPPSAHYKLSYTTSSDSGEIACNSSTTLSSTIGQPETILTAAIGDCVTIIGGSAFYGATNMTSITIPSGVVEIKSEAFDGCTSLASVAIPDTVTTISESVQPFSNCSSLASITVDSNNQYYDSRNNCNAIIKTSTNKLITGCKNTVIPNTVTEIGASAFNNCTGLTSLTIPNSVTSIGDAAFAGCTGITGGIVIPNSVTTINIQAFYHCDNATSVVIGSGVTSILQSAFNWCSSLNSITCLATTPPTIPNRVVFSNTNNCPIYVPAGSVSAYQSASGWDYHAARIQAIPNS